MNRLSIRQPSLPLGAPLHHTIPPATTADPIAKTSEAHQNRRSSVKPSIPAPVMITVASAASHTGMSGREK
jgi:hypothetical protein